MTNHTFGLVLFVWDGTTNYGAIKILVIKRRCSYPFGDFVNGSYDPRSGNFEADMKHRFSLMTAEEKTFIDSMNFATIFFKFWLMHPETSIVLPEELAKYNSRKLKFNETFVRHDHGERLQAWLRSTAHIGLFEMFEFPKGRARDSAEGEIEAAKRETLEETNIHDDMYDILPMDPVKHNFIGTDDHRTYRRTYYFGRMKQDRVRSNINHKQRAQRLEVDEITWLDLDTLEKHVPIYNNIYAAVREHCANEVIGRVTAIADA
jgi:ADP-ribose pyrophosphatase YjhB (NUDIX family)